MPLRRVGRPGLIGTAARTAVIAGTAQATAGAVARRQQNRYAQQSYEAAPPPAPAPAPAPAVPVASAQEDVVAKLERLAGLHQAGVLTDAEFAAAKAAALS